MLKVERRHWLMLTLPLLWLTAAFLIGGTETLVGNLPSAQAVAGHPTHNGERCTNDHATPSFGGTVVVDNSEVICSDLTSFGSRVVIRGEVRGNVVSFGGDVVIAGAVNGNISVYGGSIALQNSARVNGDRGLGRDHRVPALGADGVQPLWAAAVFILAAPVGLLAGAQLYHLREERSNPSIERTA